MARQALALRLASAVALIAALGALVFWGRGPRSREENRHIVRTAAERLELDPELLLAVAEVESGFDDHARSNKGALGLLQVMPGTGREVAAELKLPDYDLLDGRDNALIGGTYLNKLLRKYRKDRHLALAAYHAGPHRVDDWVERGQGLPGPEVVEMLGFKETRKYVERVLSVEGRLEKQVSKTAARPANRSPTF
jgi:soluble lytic murein transglycosylase